MNQEAPRETRAWSEVIRPQGTEGDWHDLRELASAAIRLAWSAAPREFLVCIGLQLLNATALVAQLFLAKVVFTKIGSLGPADAAQLAVPLAGLVGFGVGVQVIETISTEWTRLLSELVARRALGRVLDVSSSVELSAFESSDFYDRLQRAQAQGQLRSLQVVQGLIGLVGAATAGIALLGALTTLQPLLIPFVLLGYVPLGIASARNSRDFYGFAFELTPNDRKRNYLQGLMLHRSSAKEVRTFQLASFLRERYDQLYKQRVDDVRALVRRRSQRALTAALLSSAFTGGALALLLLLYNTGRMTLAVTGAAAVGLFQLGGQLRGVHASASSIYEATLFIRDYHTFVDAIPARTGNRQARRPRNELERLSIEKLGFAYPGMTNRTLSDVSLHVEAGEVIALVGENGSGKTTLAKLIAGLYRPSDGQILWNGSELVEQNTERVRAEIAVIFQDFERYLLSARENIGLGRCERIEDMQAIATAADRSGAAAFIRLLPKEYESLLGREFYGGSDLSTGQWQRLALARALFRDASLVVLDEPTAALDARAEHELFAKIHTLVKGRAAVVISHRFSTVRSADRIYVLDAGTIVEHGAHADLLKGGGLYAELFSLQAGPYAEAVSDGAFSHGEYSAAASE